MNLKQDNYDDVIVGSCAIVGTMAYALADTDMRILSVERRDYLARKKQIGTRSKSGATAMPQ